MATVWASVTASLDTNKHINCSKDLQEEILGEGWREWFTRPFSISWSSSPWGRQVLVLLPGNQTGTKLVKI